MGVAGNSLIKGIDVQEIISTLDRYHAQSWVIVHFSIGLKNRLEGRTRFLKDRSSPSKVAFMFVVINAILNHYQQLDKLNLPIIQ